jgi:hypothetical protein
MDFLGSMACTETAVTTRQNITWRKSLYDHA